VKNKLLIFIISYKAKYRVGNVYKKIPFKKLKKFKTKVLFSDDASRDSTCDYIKKINNKNVIKNFNAKNLGYGGNIKKCLNYSKKNKFHYAVMLHGDGQYNPKYLPAMLNELLLESVSAVTGSRMLNKKNALKGKMPIYKFLGNIILTFLTNLITSKNFTDCHSGFWAYKINIFNKIKLNKITNGFNFDQQIRLQCVKNEFKINEIPIQTFYGTERSSAHFVYAIRYFFELLKFLFPSKF